MSMIYKYTSLESALCILDSERILLNHPKEFNDLYDCVFKQSEKDKKKIQKLLKDYVVLLIMTNLVNTKEVADAGPVKFVRTQLSILKKALNKQPFYTGSPGLVFLYNQIIKRRPTIGQTFEKALTKYQEQLDEAVANAKKQILISCFSKRNDSLLMWSHYGDSHKGICLEFDRPENNDFLDVVYQNKRPEIKLFKAVSHALALAILGDKEFTGANFERIKELATPFLVKSKDWKYEREIRCLYSEKDFEKHDIVLKDDMYLLKMPKPTTVYIGCRSEGDKLKQLIKLAEEKGVKIVYMKQSDKYFVVEKQDG